MKAIANIKKQKYKNRNHFPLNFAYSSYLLNNMGTNAYFRKNECKNLYIWKNWQRIHIIVKNATKY